MQFYIENEIVRRRRAPTLDRAHIRHRVKGRIYFHHFEMPGVPAESFVRRHLLRVPALDKTGIAPAGGADENFAPGFRLAHPLTDKLPPNSATSRLGERTNALAPQPRDRKRAVGPCY